MSADLLTEREQQVLAAVIRAYVETAEPAGSRTVTKRANLGVSPATVRNTMADLEEKGYLYHPHTSAGRVPTDRAYRYYVDDLMRPVRITPAARRRLRLELTEAEPTAALERLVRRAAQALGLLTGELGVAIAPRLSEVVLDKLELISLTDEKVLLILTLEGGLVRTVYVDLPASVPPQTLQSVGAILNERLAGQTLSQIRHTLPERLRDSAPINDARANDLLEIFVEWGDELFEADSIAGDEVHLGRTSVLANQPEFATGSRLKGLIELTEQRHLLAAALERQANETNLRVTIGSENDHPELSDLAVVTAEYRSGELTGVIGVVGPTRMRYERVVAIVEHTSVLVSELLSYSSGMIGSRASTLRAAAAELERLERQA